jgi:superfamily II DNA/RNA helicase
MTFAQFNLDDKIFKAIEACGYTTPTPIQIRSIPDVMLGRDLVASAPTGTGKTAAFVLPALHRLTLGKSAKKPRILILTPTRELASQITEGASKYGKFLNFKIISLVGGMPYRQQLRELSGQVDVVVATPGRLLDHMDNKRLDLSGIEMLILDEADRMLDMGFIDDVKDIAKATPDTRQTLLFSATVDDKLATVIRQLLKDPKRIDFSNEKMAPPLIKQEIYLADNFQHKNRLLQHFLDNENIFKAIIFSATKINCDQLANELRNKGYEAAPLHGDLKQNVRNKTVDQLRRGKIQFLVATDVAARGIDINDVTHVINYDLPKFSEDYVHRIGRTGRAGKEGIAISLVLPLDARHLQKIERYIGQKLEFSVIEGLEPTKRMAKNDTNPAGKRKGFGGKGGAPRGKSGDGFAARSGKRPEARGSYARSESPRGDSAPRSESRGSYARGADSARSESRGSYARSDSAPRSEARGSYARSDSAPRSEARGSYARGGDSARSESRSYAPRGDAAPRSESRGNFARGGDSARSESRGYAPRGDAAPRSESRGNFARGGDSARSESRGYAPRGDSAPRSEARGSYARGGDSARSESRGYAPRGDSAPRGESRGNFARGGDSARSESRGSYAPRGESRGNFARGGDSAPRGESRGSYAPRGDSAPRGESRGNYARGGDSARSESRSSYAPRGDSAPRGESRGGFSRGGDKTRSTFAPRGDSARSETRSSSPKSSDPRVSYAKTSGGRRERDGFAKTGAIRSKFAPSSEAKAKRVPKEL